MSDTMFYGVLRMPFSMAMSDEMSRFQFHSRAQEAADRVERLESQIEVLRVERDQARASQFYASQILGQVFGYLPPDPVEVDGQVFVFQDPDANDTLRRLGKAIKAIPEELRADGVDNLSAELTVLRTFVREVANQHPEDCQGQRQSNKERAEDLCETWGIV